MKVKLEFERICLLPSQQFAMRLTKQLSLSLKVLTEAARLASNQVIWGSIDIFVKQQMARSGAQTRGSCARARR